MSTPPAEPTEEEMRAAYEAELARLRVEDVLLQTVVSLINLGGRKLGMAPGSEGERDLPQVAKAIDGAAALLALVEAELGPDAGQIRDALSQLQLAYVRLGGTPPAPPGAGGPAAGPAAPAPEPPQPAPAASRLWVPGQ